MEKIKKELTGKVVSTKNDKTIIVLVESYKKHPLYNKRVKRSKRYAVHDSKGEAGLGDLVSILECKPVSKTKHFYLNKIVRKAVIL